MIATPSQRVATRKRRWIVGAGFFGNELAKPLDQAADDVSHLFASLNYKQSPV